jgi:hypothetical protein
MAGTLMLHCGGEEVKFEDLARVDVPERTASYCPIPHTDLVRLTQDRMEKEYPGVEFEWEYGLNREGQQFFGVAQLQLDREDFGMSIALRNSYDKSLSVGFAAGASVFCCDNLALSGSSVTTFRKHTTNAWQDVRRMIFTGMVDTQDHYDEMKLQLNTMQEVAMDTDRGYEVIGRALGHGVLTPTQGSVAFKEWRKPSHEEFEERNVYSLYNAFTEAGKHGRAGGFMDRYTGFHDFFNPGGKVIDAEYVTH